MIKDIHAREILDSRGNPTLEVTVHSEENVAIASVPSGASTGIYEALELRDGEERFAGKGVQKAVQKVTELKEKLVGMDETDQGSVDSCMIDIDGTKQKENIGGNTMLGISIAVAKLAAKEKGAELYKHLQSLHPYFSETTGELPHLYANLINGGVHSGAGLAFQEFMVVPMTRSTVRATEVIHAVLKRIISERFGSGATGIGDEGGFAPTLASVRDALDLLVEVIQNQTQKHDVEVKIAMDVAAASFYKDGIYAVDDKELSQHELLEFYEQIVEEYPILSIEDPYEEDDFSSFAELNKHIIVVGDDLTVTSVDRLQTAIDKKSAGGIIIKPNQIGTLSETIDTIALAKKNDVKCIASHRSGETNDNFIADISYAFGCFGIKLGGLQRGERVEKYNRLLEIEAKEQ